MASINIRQGEQHLTKRLIGELLNANAIPDGRDQHHAVVCHVQSEFETVLVEASSLCQRIQTPERKESDPRSKTQDATLSEATSRLALPHLHTVVA